MTTADFKSNNIVTFFGKATTKQEIIEKLLDEVNYCKEKKQSTLRFFYNYAQDQLQFIDTNAQYRAFRELYKMQGYNFAGQSATKGITPEMVSPSVRSIKMNLFKGYKSNPVDPLATLMGYMPAETEMVIFEMDVNIFKK